MPSRAEAAPGQSIELLKELHILTREGKLNQDSRRKLKQVYHLYQFIEKLLLELPAGAGAGSRWPTTAPASRTWASSCTTCSSRPRGGGAHLRHRNPRRTGGEVARAGRSGWASPACPS